MARAAWMSAASRPNAGENGPNGGRTLGKTACTKKEKNFGFSRKKRLHSFLRCAIIIKQVRKLSSAGRASALQAEGHRFDPYNFHQRKNSADGACGNSSVVERYLAKVNVAGSSLVSRSKTKHTPCGCVFVLRNRIQTRLEGGAASGSEHFARPRYSPASLHGKTNSTVCCLAGRAAKGASLVSRSKTKHTPLGVPVRDYT